MSDSISHGCHYHYRVYGLVLGTNIEVPGLEAEKTEAGKADIEIYMGFIPEDIGGLIEQPSAKYHFEPGDETEDPPHLVVSLLAGTEYFHFHYGYGVEFVFDQRATIVWGQWKEPLTLEDSALYLLGPVIGFMLRLRGITCLHASAVVVNEYAFALTGPSGAGKSTLAASFASAGYPVLTDDVAPLTAVGDEIHIQPGYSRLRLYPNSFRNIPGLPDNLPLLAPGWDKCYLDLASEAYERCRNSAILKLIYIIDWGADTIKSPSIETMSAVAAVPVLAAHTYRNELLDPVMRKQEFVFLSRLVSRIKVKKLYPVDDVTSISHIRDLLLEDFRKETASQPSLSLRK